MSTIEKGRVVDYIYAINDGYSLSHHGIKGQKWGVRRFQNSDGSLTDEGYRHYGYGKRRGLFSPNTREKMKKGAKIGAAAGAVLGAGIAGTLLPGAGIPASMALQIGASQIAGMTAAGAWDGLRIGAIAGGVTTHLGRRDIENNPALKTRLKDFQEREFGDQETKTSQKDDRYKSALKIDPQYQKALDTYDDYSNGQKLSSKQRYEVARKLEEMGDDLRDMYSDPEVAKDIYRRAEKIAPSKR